MALMLGGNTIAVPHFDALRHASAKENYHNEFAQRIIGTLMLQCITCFNGSLTCARPHSAASALPAPPPAFSFRHDDPLWCRKKATSLCAGVALMRLTVF
eukprot:5065353-Pleurochrysis_carterae.AAC.5